MLLYGCHCGKPPDNQQGSQLTNKNMVNRYEISGTGRQQEVHRFIQNIEEVKEKLASNIELAEREVEFYPDFKGAKEALDAMRIFSEALKRVSETLDTEKNEPYWEEK